MPKPRKIVLKLDEQKRFGAEVFDLVRTKLTPKIGGNVNLGVKLAAEYFAPRKPGEVTMVEVEAAIDKIVEKFEAETKKPAGNDGRLPLNDEAQMLWDSGQWRGKLTVHGLRKRFEAEIGDNVDLTVGMIDAFAAELAAEKARVVELANEHYDPDSKTVACESPVHRGEEKQFQPTVRFRLTRNDAGELVRMKHPQGDDFIEVGNFLVVPAGDVEGATDRAVPYCADCREAAWALGRETETKVTFYTTAYAKRKLGAMQKSAEGNAALGDQIKKAAARVFGGSGTRNQRDWRTTRRPRGR